MSTMVYTSDSDRAGRFVQACLGSVPAASGRAASECSKKKRAMGGASSKRNGAGAATVSSREGDEQRAGKGVKFSRAQSRRLNTYAYGYGAMDEDKRHRGLEALLERQILRETPAEFRGLATTDEKIRDQSCCFLRVEGQGLSDISPQTCSSQRSIVLSDAFSRQPSVVSWFTGVRPLNYCHHNGERAVKLASAQSVVLRGEGDDEGIALGSTFTLNARVCAPLPDGDIFQGLTMSVCRPMTHLDEQSGRILVPKYTDLYGPVRKETSSIGNLVVLSYDYKQHGDAANGPLKEGEVGRVSTLSSTRTVRTVMTL